MRSTGLFALALAAVIPACGDDIKFPETDLPDPALNGVFPASGFTDRKIRVEISGDATEFSSGATVSFSGTGVTANNTALASPSDLFIDVTIAGDAAVGKRDVIVTDGDKMLTLAQAFEVKVPLEIFVTGGEAEQGGIADLLIINHDPENPFLGDLQLTGTNGATLFVNSNTENTIDAIGFFDADATTGSFAVTDTLADTVTSHGLNLVVTPRTPTALTAPVKSNIDFSASTTLTHRTGLFSFTADSGIYRGTVTPDDTFFEPLVIWLKNGKWAESRGFVADDLVPMGQGENGLVVVVEGFFDNNFSFTLDVDNFTPLPNVQALADTEPNDPIVFGVGTAQPLAGPATLFTGSFSPDDFVNQTFDNDTMSVTLTDGQSIHVTTTNGVFGNADTSIEIDDAQGLVDFSDSDFVGSAEDLVTGPLPAGEYFIILSSPVTVNADTGYEAGIVIEDAALATAPRRPVSSQARLVHGIKPATAATLWHRIQRKIQLQSL